VAYFQRTGEIPAQGGSTNGAAMRALPIGWALPAKAERARREWSLALSRITHTGSEALAAASVISAWGSWSLEGASVEKLFRVASEERAARSLMPALESVMRGTWRPPEEAGLDPVTTVASVLHCLKAEQSLRESLILAVSLGGDTDTVAALVGGLVGAQKAPDLPYIDLVILPAKQEIEKIARALAKLREEHG
jgi:ADP-ribosylglycohydrolase